MKIIELSTDRLPSPPTKGGAIERYVYQLSRSLCKLGVEVHLISIGNVKHFSVERQEGLYRHVYPEYNPLPYEKLLGSLIAKYSSRLNEKLLYISRSLPLLFYRIKSNFGDVDVIHNHYFTTAFAPIIFKQLVQRDVLLISSYHNVPKENTINRLTARFYDVHLAVSNYVRKEIIKRLGMNLQRTHVLYNGIDVNEFNCSESEKDKLRAQYGLSEDEIVLSFIGRITPEKGVHHLIEAFKIVKHTLTQYRLKLVIAGPIGQFDHVDVKSHAYFKYINLLIKKYNLERDIVFLGYIQSSVILYVLSDIVIVPSVWQDPMPSVVIEALASCRPVVAYPVGGIPEILAGLPYDLLADRVDVHALAQKISSTILNIDKIYGKSLREYVERKFSTDVVAKQLLEIIEEYRSRVKSERISKV